LAEVRGSVEQEPMRAVGRDGGLGLGTRTSTDNACANTHALGTGTIPLGETTPGCGAEDFNAHTGTPAYDRWARP